MADGATITPTGTNYAISVYGTDADRAYYVDGYGCECVAYCLGRHLFYRNGKSPPSLRYEIVFDANTGVQRAVTLTFEGLDASDASLSPRCYHRDYDYAGG